MFPPTFHGATVVAFGIRRLDPPKFLEPLRNRQIVAIQLRYASIREFFPIIYRSLRVSRSECTVSPYLVVCLRIFAHFFAHPLISPLIPDLSGVSVHFLQLRLFFAAFSDLCDLLRLRLLWTCSYHPTADSGISSKHTLGMPYLLTVFTIEHRHLVSLLIYCIVSLFHLRAHSR